MKKKKKRVIKKKGGKDSKHPYSTHTLESLFSLIILY